MSRIGKLPIKLPTGVSALIKDNEITVKGKLGELKQHFDSEIKIKIEDGYINVERPSESKNHKSLHGLYRSLLNNMVIGVSEGFKIEQELVGVGYRVSNKGNLLELSLGYSHNIIFEVPKEIKIETKTERGATPKITMLSADKQLIGQVASKIRALRKPEPYKGKGIKFVGEQIRKKAGKSAASAK